MRDWHGDQEPPDSFNQEAFQDAMAALVSDQEHAGLDIITDGRLHGDNYADQALYYYYRRLGYDLHGGYLGFPIYSRLHAGTADQEIKRHGAIMVEQARALKRATNKPTKVQYTGVQVLAQATNDLHYDDAAGPRHGHRRGHERGHPRGRRDGRRLHPARRVHLALLLRGLGHRGVQPRGQGVQNAQIIVHVCWGNWGGTPAYFPDETAQAGEIFDLTKRVGDGAVGDGDGGPEVLRGQHRRAQPGELRAPLRRPLRPRRDQEPPAPDNVMFWAGVIDVKSTITETAEQVADRINRLLEYVPADKLGVTTDCGLILLQRYIAIDKLHALVAGTELVRQKLG